MRYKQLKGRRRKAHSRHSDSVCILELTQQIQDEMMEYRISGIQNLVKEILVGVVTMKWILNEYFGYYSCESCKGKF